MMLISHLAHCINIGIFSCRYLLFYYLVADLKNNRCKEEVVGLLLWLWEVLPQEILSNNEEERETKKRK